MPSLKTRTTLCDSTRATYRNRVEQLHPHVCSEVINSAFNLIQAEILIYLYKTKSIATQIQPSLGEKNRPDSKIEFDWQILSPEVESRTGQYVATSQNIQLMNYKLINSSLYFATLVIGSTVIHRWTTVSQWGPWMQVAKVMVGFKLPMCGWNSILVW